MLIMSEKQRKAAGIESLEQRCTYCSKVRKLSRKYGPVSNVSL